MGTRGLPDMSTLSPQAYGSYAESGHIRQTTRACIYIYSPHDQFTLFFDEKAALSFCLFYT